MEEIHSEKGPVTIVTCYGALAVINAGAACSRNIRPLLIIRLITGDFGSSLPAKHSRITGRYV